MDSAGLMCLDKVAASIAYGLPSRGYKLWNKADRPPAGKVRESQWWNMVPGYNIFTKGMWKQSIPFSSRHDGQLNDENFREVTKWRKDFVKYLLCHEHVSNTNLEDDPNKPKKIRSKFAVISRQWCGKEPLNVSSIPVGKRRNE